MELDLVTKERWKRVVGYNNYIVSNKGRVYSLKSKKFMSQSNKDGYRRIDLTKNNRKLKWFIHVLVARAFIINPERKPMVNHKDLNRSNNNLENLEWVTAKENTEHADANGKIKRGLEHGRNKLTKEQIYAIREDTRNNYRVCGDYGVSANCIRKIKLRLSYGSL